MKFEVGYFLEVLPKIIKKLDVTLQLTLIATVSALIIGLFIAVITYYRIKIIYPITRMYVFLMRGTPVVAQLYFFYFGLAIYSVFIKDMRPLTAVAIVMSMNIGAFMSESIRAALMSVDEGQKEAAYSLGMSNF